MKEELLKELGDIVINECDSFIKMIEKHKLTNEQWFIEFEDRLNELSIKNHN